MRGRGALAAGVVLLASCGGGSARVESAGALDGDLFDRTATAIDGEAVDLAAFRDRDLVVWFWAPW